VLDEPPPLASPQRRMRTRDSNALALSRSAFPIHDRSGAGSIGAGNEPNARALAVREPQGASQAYLRGVCPANVRAETRKRLSTEGAVRKYYLASRTAAALAINILTPSFLPYVYRSPRLVIFFVWECFSGP
jgi:hypothetical protein